MCLFTSQQLKHQAEGDKIEFDIQEEKGKQSAANLREAA